MIDADGDGIPDVFDSFERIALMEGARLVEAMMARRRALNERAASAAEHDRQEAQARLRAEATQSRYRLEPVLSDGWWARADLETIGRRYAEAKAWDGIDPTFLPFVERIEERAKALHDLEPEHIMDEVKAKDRVPLTLDEARYVAAQDAPQWYRLHDRLAEDLGPYERQDAEARVIADMTHMRDTGRLDTDSAKLEWARFSDHQPALRRPVEGETMDQRNEAVKLAAAEHWVATAEVRQGLSAPLHGDSAVVARPMSVPEARAFMMEFAPDWFKFGYEQGRDGPVDENLNTDPVHAARVDDQMRYAMEGLRDTGTLSHPYAQSMRDALEHHPEVDTTEGPGVVAFADRVRYGGSPTARPLTDSEALDVMRDYAPDWYKKPMFEALSPDSMLSQSQRAGQIDLIRADMQTLRDRGTLSTEHAMTVWAAQVPEGRVEVETEHGWPVAPPKAQDVWAETAERRPGPLSVPQDVRERLGGISAPPEGVDRFAGRSAAYQGPVTVEAPEPEPRRWDDPKRRAERAEELKQKGWSPQAVKAYLAADVSTAKSGAQVDVEAKAQHKGHGMKQGQARKKRQRM